MMHSEALVSTPLARRYLGQLCKHFEHRLDVTYTATDGMTRFPAGICRVEALEDQLVLRAEAEDAERLAQVQDVTQRHLLRFAFRDAPAIEWCPLRD